MTLDVGHQEPRLEKARHVKYWLRCLKTLLPSLYTSNDSNRMYLAYFILSACDLLDVIATSTQPEERREWIDWIYHCQHPRGGFRMWPGTDFGERANEENAKWDPANVPATYFALASLLILGDDLRRVRRKDTLCWVHAMQRDDGSFGETLVEGKREGGRDPRFGYCATGIRRILRGACPPGPIDVDGERIDDINLDTYVKCIRNSENFDGGIADAAFHEPQAGYTFCALGSLAFINRLEPGHLTQARSPDRAPSHPHDVVRWLLSLQTDFTDPESPPSDEAQPATSSKEDALPSSSNNNPPPTNLHQSPEKSTMWAASDPSPTLDSAINPTPPLAMAICPSHTGPIPTAEPTPAGMCGRPSKPADTCYAFWAGASLELLLKQQKANPTNTRSPQTPTPEYPTLTLHSPTSLRTYLLTQTQHPLTGGFTKFPHEKWADLYHSYLGLAALSLCSSPAERERDGLKQLDAGMCVGVGVRTFLEQVVWEGF